MTLFNGAARIVMKCLWTIFPEINSVGILLAVAVCLFILDFELTDN